MAGVQGEWMSRPARDGVVPTSGDPSVLGGSPTCEPGTAPRGTIRNEVSVSPDTVVNKPYY